MFLGLIRSGPQVGRHEVSARDRSPRRITRISYWANAAPTQWRTPPPNGIQL